MGVLGAFKSVDFYKRVPRDLTEGTFSGAILTISCVVIGFILIISSISEYMTTRPHTEMLVDEKEVNTQIEIYIDMIFPHIPCQIVNIDAADILGNHFANIGNERITKSRINQRSEVIGSYKEASPPEQAGLFQDALSNEEGCQVKGRLKLKKIPGNFHISAHSSYSLLSAAKFPRLDYSHKINELYFGNRMIQSRLKRRFKDVNLNPLNDVISKAPNVDEPKGPPLAYSYNYYLTAVKCNFEEKSRPRNTAYQFTVSKSTSQVGGNQMPQVKFQYEFSPIYVKYTIEESNFLHFLVNLCAIIGGLFTVFGIIDGIIHKTISKIFKDSIGKLS